VRFPEHDQTMLELRLADALQRLQKRDLPAKRRAISSPASSAKDDPMPGWMNAAHLPVLRFRQGGSSTGALTASAGRSMSGTYARRSSWPSLPRRRQPVCGQKSPAGRTMHQATLTIRSARSPPPRRRRRSDRPGCNCRCGAP
jgi:hypothetical protein